MAWIAVDKDGKGHIYDPKPTKGNESWINHGNQYSSISEHGIEMIVGKLLTWEDEPVQVKFILTQDKIEKTYAIFVDVSYREVLSTIDITLIENQQEFIEEHLKEYIHDKSYVVAFISKQNYKIEKKESIKTELVITKE